MFINSNWRNSEEVLINTQTKAETDYNSNWDNNPTPYMDSNHQVLVVSIY